MDNQKQTPRRWHRLDNTANLFPVITSKRFSNVYRITLDVTEPVAAELLQKAVEIVLPRFAAFRVRLRRGVFWHYLEANPGTPLVYEEDSYPCSYIDPQQNQNFLFRFTYYGTRINLEVFHVLSDGTGALQFLQAVVCRYLLLYYPTHFTPEERARQWFSQHAEDTEDSYVANYVPTKKAGFRIGRGFRLSGERSPLGEVNLIQANIPVKPLLGVCRSKGVSLTHYITACIGWAIYEEQMHSRTPRHPVNLFMPVNLRNLFPSTTTLNFFSNIYISMPFTPPGLTFDDLLADIKTQFEEKLTREGMLEKISYTVGSGYNPVLRVVPLPLKNLALRAVFEASAGSSTLGFSNMGRVQMPAPFTPYVKGTGLQLSCAPREPFKCAATSYGDMLCLSFTSLLRSTAIQRNMVRQLSALGLDITIQTNGVSYENM